jgi:hypothetical protein
MPGSRDFEVLVASPPRVAGDWEALSTEAELPVVGPQRQSAAEDFLQFLHDREHERQTQLHSPDAARERYRQFESQVAADRTTVGAQWTRREALKRVSLCAAGGSLLTALGSCARAWYFYKRSWGRDDQFDVERWNRANRKRREAAGSD